MQGERVGAFHPNSTQNKAEEPFKSDKLAHMIQDLCNLKKSSTDNCALQTFWLHLWTLVANVTSYTFIINLVLRKLPNQSTQRSLYVKTKLILTEFECCIHNQDQAFCHPSTLSLRRFSQPNHE